MQQTKTPQVNEINEFLEIASDFEDPLEVIRESLSNSYDAQATQIDIEITNSESGSDIVIEDDGRGMRKAELPAFFDLGNSMKTDAIGYKGHGTKIFYKSDHIAVETVDETTGVHRRAEMDRPWEKLNDRELPTYEVTTGDDATQIDEGTRIEIRGFKSGQGFDPTSMTYNKIEHYIAWKTIGGSTRHFFDDEAREMDITVRLGDEIDDSREPIEMTNLLEFPDEQLEPTGGVFPAERMCKHYPPRELEVEYDGGSTTVQIVGMIGDKAARNELPTYGKHSAQFGVWLAKDHIKIEQVNDVISHDNEYIHFFFIANCQDLELSANRETIRNKSSGLYQAILDRLDHYMSKVASDPWFKEYLEYRREGRLNRAAKSQQDAIESRVDEVESRDEFMPSNSVEVVAGLERSNFMPTQEELVVEDFAPRDNVNAIIRTDKGLQQTIVDVTLADVFDQDTPLANVDTIVCWNYGDRDELRELERVGYLGGDIQFDFEENEVWYLNGHEMDIDVIPVEDRLNGAQY
jgi:hypothetical protein